jgi:hypothetical protein
MRRAAHGFILAFTLAFFSFAVVHGDDEKRELSLVGGKRAVKLGQVAKARSIFQSLIRRHIQVERGRVAEALLALGDLEERGGRPGEARTQYNRLIDLLPERRGDINEAESRLRAMRHDGGRFLVELLSRMNRALGRTRLDRLRTVEVDGELIIGEQRVEMLRRMTTRPVRMREDAPSLKLVKAWDGKKGWLQKDKKVELIRGPKLDRTVSWAYESLRALLGVHEGQARYVGSSRVLGRPAFRLEYRQGSGPVLWTEDVDSESFLPARARGTQIDASGKLAAMTLYYHDWKSVDGAKFPGRIEFYKGDKLAYEFRFKKYRLDTEMDPTLFSPPEK